MEDGAYTPKNLLSRSTMLLPPTTRWRWGDITKSLLAVILITGMLLMVLAVAALAQTGTGHTKNGPLTTASRLALVVVDSNGKKVGNWSGKGLGNSTDLAATFINGAVMTLPVSQDGFVDEASPTGGLGFLVLMYPTTDCSGQGYIELGSGTDPATNKPLNILPIVQESTDGGSIGLYIFNNILYYAQQPYSQQVFLSYAYFTDPNAASVGGCQPIPSNAAETGTAGPVTTFDLSTLGLTPPFKIL